MAKRPGGGGGETVLEGRHLLAVFFAIVVLSAVFFTLGYVLGRMQGEMRGAGAAALKRPGQPQAGGKAPGGATSTPAGGAPSDLSFYNTVEKKDVDTRLESKPAAPSATQATAPSAFKKSEATKQPPPQAGGISLQVAALIKREDAESMAEVLRHKRYPVVVLPPSNDQFYRVQVGPFPSEQAASQMRKRLEDEGFKVITKH